METLVQKYVRLIWGVCILLRVLDQMMWVLIKPHIIVSKVVL
jgi:hypothetical protein